MPPESSKHWVPTLCTFLGCRVLKTQIKKGWMPTVWLAGLPSPQTQTSKHWAPAGYPVLCQILAREWPSGSGNCELWSQAKAEVSDHKESACNAGDLGSLPRLGRSPRGKHGNTFWYSCLETPHGQRSLGGLQSMGSQKNQTGLSDSTQHKGKEPPCALAGSWKGSLGELRAGHRGDAGAIQIQECS